ncbi:MULTISPECIES: alpha-hydroxyketone-type quorum-sensing autoinducer synthase [Vibrio]|uniref:Alpha-hydroxyketone-type quorum-sensing autoinducer synthase n=1 Tax=Vibrio cortegadensis TaxID=1328770 RepID=A0ABV4M9J1_9VIBR|nr:MULTISPECIES: alpha-hydroxyketone-type quorum-sensing autoinducer synthase [Vibrio]MDN3696223.1 quorum-sensing autoinducer CAI-1 synthase [Vibrio cortegadensis]RBW65051.1 quorum-sensing autoinducer synthase [Vibrionales bacterium C3R12]TKF18935.1 quorum-sensing autoinducer synthase [Vibrio genomosp. F6]
MQKPNSVKPLPTKIENKLDRYLSDNIKPRVNGKHLVLGNIPDIDSIFLQSNDYLSLSGNQKLKDKHITAIQEHNESVVMSGVFLQNESDIPSFQSNLAKYVGFADCNICQSGWDANIGLLQTICEQDTKVYIDFFAHMSLWEGARIAGADIYPFIHNSVRHLKKLVKRHGPGIILVDSIYSIRGSVTPLQEIVEIAEEFECAIVVDESHSLGVIGQSGRGLVHSLNLSHKVDFITVSLAKTFAYRAGAVLSHGKLAQCLPFISNPAIFSSALLPHELDRLDATLDIIIESDVQRANLFSMSEKLRNALRSLGFNIGSETQIISLETGDEVNTEKVRDFFYNNGVIGSVFCSPATLKSKNNFRFSLHSKLNEHDINKIIHVCDMAINNDELYFLD